MVENDFALFHLYFGFIVLLRHASLFRVRPRYRMAFPFIRFDQLICWYRVMSAIANDRKNGAIGIALATSGPVSPACNFSIDDVSFGERSTHRVPAKAFLERVPVLPIGHHLQGQA